MFLRATGRPRLLELTNAISTDYNLGDLIYADGSGAFIPADSTAGDIYGIAAEELDSDDARYTTAGKISVDLLMPGELVRCDDVDGILTAAMEGTTMDLANAESVNAAGSSKLVVTLVKYISATEGIFMINALASVYRVATT